ncbi:MAG: sigma-54-dependent transcriptional regulator [Thermodesulfobacteriota bacterium]
MDTKIRIMIVDDEMIVRQSLLTWFKKYGHEVETAASGLEALEKLEQKPYQIMFVDIKMPGMDGLELLEKVKQEYPEILVVIITAYGSIESAVNAMRTGASDYLLKPFKPDQLSLVMERITCHQKITQEYQYLKGHLEQISRFDNIIGQSAPMKKLYEIIPEVAASDASILITGETGTGKELVARAIHAKSLRAELPFIAINCGALPDTLMESELFGHKKGAFTGAAHARKGFLEIVSGGTLFLDEIGDISPKMQVDLLRVLEEKQIFRVGSETPVAVDFRLVSATRHHLEDRIQEGAFREDFYYRVNVIKIRLPALRERKDDIGLLAEHFMEKYSHETTKIVDRITPDAVTLLTSYDWPGNVRELENAIERAVVLSKSRTLTAGDFSFLQPARAASPGSKTLKAVQKDHILRVLDEQGWQITRSAQILGINRATLYKIIKRDQLKKDR